MNNWRIEIRYAVLINLLMLLWLATEFLVGLHDTFIQFHPYVTMLAIVIPVACSRLAISAKTEELNGKISFKQAFVTGAVIAVLSAVLMVGTQYVFHALINPDFFDNMVAYSVKQAELKGIDTATATTDAQRYFNLTAYLLQSSIFALVFGLLLALFWAWRLRTEK